jgi:hypothetical protein
LVQSKGVNAGFPKIAADAGKHLHPVAVFGTMGKEKTICFTKESMSQLTRSIISIWKVLTGEPNMGRLLQAVVQTAEIMTGAEYGEILMAGDSWERLEYQFATDEELVMLRMVQKSTGVQIIGVARRDGVKLELETEGSEKAFSSTEAAAPHAISASLAIEKKEIGILRLFNKPSGFTQEDRDFLKAFAEQVTASIDREILRGRLLKAESRLQGIFNAIADGILVVKGDGTPVISNMALQKMLYPDETANAALETILPSLYNPEMEEGFQELVLLKPHSKILSSHFVNIRNRGGEIEEVILSLRNITKSKDEERKFLQLITMIARRVGKQTPALAVKKASPARKRRFRRIRSFVKNLIWLTEIKSGPLRLQRLPMEMNELVVELVERYTKRFARKQVEFCVREEGAEFSDANFADSDLIKDSLQSVFAFHRRNLKPGTRLSFENIRTQNRFLYRWKTAKDAWKKPPITSLLDWEQCVERFISNEKQPFLLDLPFARHVFESHKGDFQLHADADHFWFEVTFPRED